MNRESSSLSPPIRLWRLMFSGSGSVVEHLLAKEKVAGSIPVSRSIHPDGGYTHVFSQNKRACKVVLRRGYDA